MSRAFSCLVAVLLWAPPASAQAPSQPARDTPTAVTGGTAVIRGRVVEAATGKGLSRVQVRANTNTPGPPPNPYPWLAMTDGDGRYEIKGLPANTYAVVATKTNYVRSAYGEARVEGPGRRLPVAEGEVVDKIDIRMTRAGVVTGKVVDEFGDPVTDVFVTAMRYQYIQGSRRLMQSGRGGSTNDVGEYRVYGLTPGRYFISASLRNFQPMNTDSTDRSAYAPTFFPGTGNVAEAQRLTIAPGQIITSTNMTLLPIQTARVRGIALDADGKPMSNAMVNVMQRMGAAMVGNSGSPVQTDGKFTLNLTPGDYTLRVFGAGVPDGAFTDLTVNGSDIDGVQIMAVKPSTIRGRLVFTDSASGAPPPKPAAFDLGAAREWMIGQPVRSQAKVKDDYTFEISVPPGHVLIRGLANGQGAGPTAQPWRLNRVIVNDLDVADSGIDVGSNSTIENVVVEWTNHSNEVTGKVTDADGKAVRDCFVIVFAQDPAHWTVQTRHLAVSRPGLDDNFHTRVLAGDYYAVAMSDVETNAWTDPEFLALAREKAVKFTIADGEKKTIDLPLSAAPVF
jgi:protocatechuate 3,4-dioxygenase beta subunit